MEIVKEIGAYAGFAAVLGLAVLAALYFSQARDLRRLREWAGRAPERAADQPGRVPAVPGRAASVPAAAPVAVASGSSGRDTPLTVPGSTGSSAPDISTTPSAPAPARAPAAAVMASAAVAGKSPARATDDQRAGSEEGATGPGVPVNGTAAVSGEAAVPGDAGPAKAPPQPGEQPPSGRAQAPPARPSLASAGAAPVRRAGAPSRRPGPVLPPKAVIERGPWYRRIGWPAPRFLALIVAGVVVVGAGAGYAIDRLASGGPPSGGDPASSDNRAGGDGKQARRAPVEPADVTVAVLNGTTVPGLAAQVGDEVAAAGFQRGTVTNATGSPERAESVVLYRKGAPAEARAVARKLRISQIEEIDPDSQAIAGDASVVVIVGADQTR